MSEILDDLKINDIDINSSLGINLTSENSRIKHTGSGNVELSSNGTILLKSGDNNGSNIELTAGNAGNNSFGGDLVLSGGNHGGNLNSRGGHIIMDSLMTLPTFQTKPNRDAIDQPEAVAGDISFISGSQVLCLHDGDQWSNLAIPNTDTSFKYFKWVISKVSDNTIVGDNSIQVSKFKFMDGGNDRHNMNLVICSTNAPNYEEHPISNLIDGDINTFWYSNISELTGSVEVIFQFPTAVSTDGYRWATGPDSPYRDPVSWKVYGSNNNLNWHQLDELIDYSSTSSPINRNTYTVLRYDIDNRKQLISYNDDLTFKALNGCDVNIGCEPGISGPPGRINMLNVMRSVVFANDDERDLAIRTPQIGDICFVITGTNPSGNLKLQVYTGFISVDVSGWQICN